MKIPNHVRSRKISPAKEIPLSLSHFMKTLKGYWKLRVGDYRVIFKVVGNEVWIFAIINRKDVYSRIIKRI